MEIFYITFHMNNEKTVVIEKEEDTSYDFSTILEHNKSKWYVEGSKIINLDNVNYVNTETKTERENKQKQADKQQKETLESFSKLNF